MIQSNTNRLLGIADPSWPTTSLIEKRAIELGYEAVVTSTPGNLESQASEFGIIVVHLPKGGSIQSIIESMKLFDDVIQFIVLTDTSDQQSVKTLERIPGVSVCFVSQRSMRFLGMIYLRSISRDLPSRQQRIYQRRKHSMCLSIQSPSICWPLSSDLQQQKLRCCFRARRAQEKKSLREHCMRCQTAPMRRLSR